MNMHVMQPEPDQYEMRPIEKVSKIVVLQSLYIQKDKNVTLRFVDKGYERKVLVSLPKVKGFYDEI